MTTSLFKTPMRLNAQLLHNSLFNNGTICLKSLSTSYQIYQQTNDQTLDYLIHTLGLSQESALAASKRINLKETENPNSVLALFKSYGFNSSHISNIVYRNPGILLADPDTIIKPKLEFLSQNGISGLVLADLISKDHNLLRRSLEKQIIPCFEFLKNFFGGTKGIISLFSANRGTWILHKFSESVAPNIELLRNYGVPDSNIAKMIWVRPRTLSRDVEEFKEIVEEIRQMGFDPSSLMFIYGVCALSGMKKDKWVSKFNVFKSFGWSEEQFQSLFVKQPKIMNSSEERIKRALHFFTNELGWTAEEFSKYPVVIFLSFEKRVIPRSFILQHLLSKGYIKKTSVGNGLTLREDKFLVKFVTQYLSMDPHLLEMYQEKKAII